MGLAGVWQRGKGSPVPAFSRPIFAPPKTDSGAKVLHLSCVLHLHSVFPAPNLSLPSKAALEYLLLGYGLTPQPCACNYPFLRYIVLPMSQEFHPHLISSYSRILGPIRPNKRYSCVAQLF